MGASGAGATTLGRAVATAWSVPHADSDDFYWVPTSPAYTTPRSVDERVALMEAMFVPRAAWVLSGDITSWGRSVIDRCDAVVFLTLDPDERRRRLERRQDVRREGESIDDASTSAFLAWAIGYDDPAFPRRSRRSHEAWLETLRKPVLRLESAQPVDELCRRVLDWQPHI
ncbi:adenylate kinase [Brachybacterium phenoliresistens]